MTQQELMLARDDSAFHGLTPRGREGGLGALGLVRSRSPSPVPGGKHTIEV